MNFGGAIHINRGVLLLLCGFVLVVILLYKNSNSEMQRASQLIRDMQKINLKHILSAAIDAAERGGKQVYNVRVSADLNQKSKGETAEGANDPLTDGDIKSHLEMYYSLKNTFPNLDIISEEKTVSQEGKIIPANIQRVSVSKLPDVLIDSKDISIWIDPLDATQEYTENLREYVTTMVCVAVNGQPIIGVIHKPFMNQTYWAWSSVANAPAIEVVPQLKSVPEPVKIIVSRSHKGEVEKVAHNAFGPSSIITGAGGAGFKSLEVLKGTQDVYVHTTLIKKWDICAPNAILNHFEGKLTTLEGKEIDYSGSSDVKNKGGVVAALYNHKFYLQKLYALNSSG